jgi:hypothetical protein
VAAVDAAAVAGVDTAAAVAVVDTAALVAVADTAAAVVAAAAIAIAAAVVVVVAAAAEAEVAGKASDLPIIRSSDLPDPLAAGRCSAISRLPRRALLFSRRLRTGDDARDVGILFFRVGIVFLALPIALRPSLQLLLLLLDARQLLLALGELRPSIVH